MIFYGVLKKRISFDLELEEKFERKLILNNPQFPSSVWTMNEGIENWISVEEFIRHLYMNMVNKKLRIL